MSNAKKIELGSALERVDLICDRAEGRAYVYYKGVLVESGKDIMNLPEGAEVEVLESIEELNSDSNGNEVCRKCLDEGKLNELFIENSDDNPQVYYKVCDECGNQVECVYTPDDFTGATEGDR